MLAGVVAWVGMAGWALVGVTLAGFGAAATPAAVALALGGAADLTRNVGPRALTGSISVVPLGVSLVGAVLLATVLTAVSMVRSAPPSSRHLLSSGARRWRGGPHSRSSEPSGHLPSSGTRRRRRAPHSRSSVQAEDRQGWESQPAPSVSLMWHRVAGAAGVFLAGLVVLPFLPAGDLDIRFWPTVLGGVLWLAVVLAVWMAMGWAQAVRHVVTVLLAAAGIATVVGAAAAFAGGARVLGTMVLAAPNLLCVALTRGLGVPWTVVGPDLPLLGVETGGLGPLAVPMWPLAALAAAVVVLVAVFAGWHTPWVVALCFTGMAVLGGAEVTMRTGFFGIELGVSGNVLVAAGVGLLAGLAACLLVGAVRYWHRQRS